LTELREFSRQKWRLRALGEYGALLVSIAKKRGLTSDLAERIERAIAEAQRTEDWLDQTADKWERR
jgi:ABC-type molybdate transport system permease subunit